MEDGKKEISTIIDDLSAEFDKLIISNPHVFCLLCKNKAKVTYYNKKNQLVEYEFPQVYEEYKRHDNFSRLIYFIVGFICCCIIISIAHYLCNHYHSFVPAFLKNDGEPLLGNLANAMPLIVSLFTLLIGFWAIFIRVIAKDYFTNKVLISIIFYFLVGCITAYSSKFSPGVLLYICPLLGCIVLLSSLVLIYNPLSSKELNKNIIRYTEQLQSKIESLNSSTVLSTVQQSHSSILEQINRVEDYVIHKNTNELLKIQSLSVLDSLRLELIQNSINGINLVEDWKYLDLSQRMIDDIMSCKNKRITILGDFSFLSTEKGLKELVYAIQEKDKSFDIYFTGDRKDPQTSHIIVSKPCEEFVKRIKQEYSNNLPIITKIATNVHLFPILSEYFTGIGFIGLISNESTNSNIVYDKVFAYISSHLITHEDPDITRANPFVFCWDSRQTFYFKDFIHKRKITDNKLRVWMDGKEKQRTEILSIETLTDKKPAVRQPRKKKMTTKCFT